MVEKSRKGFSKYHLFFFVLPNWSERNKQHFFHRLFPISATCQLFSHHYQVTFKICPVQKSKNMYFLWTSCSKTSNTLTTEPKNPTPSQSRHTLHGIRVLASTYFLSNYYWPWNLQFQKLYVMVHSTPARWQVISGSVYRLNMPVGSMKSKLG
jgi:hypothetical protein